MMTYVLLFLNLLFFVYGITVATPTVLNAILTALNGFAAILMAIKITREQL